MLKNSLSLKKNWYIKDKRIFNHIAYYILTYIRFLSEDIKSNQFTTVALFSKANNYAYACHRLVMDFTNSLHLNEESFYTTKVFYDIRSNQWLFNICFYIKEFDENRYYFIAEYGNCPLSFLCFFSKLNYRINNFN